MAVMVKVLLPSFQAEVNPPLNWNRLVLLIVPLRLLPTAKTPSQRSSSPSACSLSPSRPWPEKHPHVFHRMLSQQSIALQKPAL